MSVVAVAMAVFVLYTSVEGPWPPLVNRALFLGLGFVLVGFSPLASIHSQSLHQTHFRITPISKSDPSDHLQMHAGKLGFVLVLVIFSSPRFFPCRPDPLFTSSPLPLSLSSRSIASSLLSTCRLGPLFTSSLFPTFNLL